LKRDPVRALRRGDSGRGLKVRVARRSDRAAVAALWESADMMHARLHPAYFRGDGRLDPRLADGLERASESRELFVAEQQGSVIGFVLVELLEPARASAVARARRGHIDTLVVAERARRKGCGRRLVEQAIEWARAHRVEEMLLTVWAGNVDAERFYRALGLQPVSSVLRLGL
jgi:GNAT superfamily N-acetyltransferase